MKERLNRLIEDKKLTATKFAALIDANPSAISHILKGRNKPGYDLLVNISTAFPDISMDWLLTGKGNMYNSPTNNQITNSHQQQALPLSELFSRQVEEEKTAEKPKSEVKPILNIPVAPQHTTANDKRIIRTILFFDDGSFEDYVSLK
ncbi:MAG: helix-turn-helix transcriptional regulator, partial [Odoribacter sp.]|nr:helix-turn-helix transcriptional regulator [Odoribacter sp.]